MNVKWTTDEKEFIKNNAGFMKDRELARRLESKSGRTVTVDALRKVRQKMGIKKKHGRGICALVYSPEEEESSGLSNGGNEGGSSQEVSD